MAFNWTCPHCDRDQVVVDDSWRRHHIHLGLEKLVEGSVGFSYSAIACANAECRKLTLDLRVGPDKVVKRQYVTDYQLTDAPPLFLGRIIPPGRAKPQPDYVPAALREDYLEACLIRDLSPKASATLARRCLQGMIRDFTKIVKPTLDQEIKALRATVDEGRAPQGITQDTVDAIDHVRGVGNIGAHMEKDIDLIVEIDPGEAQALIELIEMLFDEWYVARHKRQERLAKIATIGAEKKEARKGKATPGGDSEPAPIPAGDGGS